ncbi:hypothetical protein GUJ93_ZPchr0002g23845 [Zizania palustris]|uniref:WRC domain-containing protein n=1 Tax=Zizania palustris TaxID=103762 RepID=A0A8J5RRN0_ZIZPA|nr:hypothetical protein GUJ93_ZPchr0002g23845 [Zizania palustris]
MRIRRRPQAQVLSSLRPSDPSTAPQPPPNASRSQERRRWLRLSGDGKEEELHLHRTADLGEDDDDEEPSVARRAAAALLPLFPQDNATAVERSRRQPGGAHQGAPDGHRSGVESNGHCSKQTEPMAIGTGERLVNGVVGAIRRPPVPRVTVNANEEAKNDGGGGGKKRRGPAVLMEGSRCSRVNGRGWRCSQPTLVGYSLCEHHLGKGRMRSLTGGGRGGAGQLGRTEPRKNAAAVAAGVTSRPKAAEPPVVRPC